MKPSRSAAEPGTATALATVKDLCGVAVPPQKSPARQGAWPADSAVELPTGSRAAAG
ncbi:hypothetical protein GCM10010398_34100 [Streptomyces fimbriatus]